MNVCSATVGLPRDLTWQRQTTGTGAGGVFLSAGRNTSASG